MELIRDWLTECSYCGRDISKRCTFVIARVDFEESIKEEFKMNPSKKGIFPYQKDRPPAKVILLGYDSQIRKKGWDVMFATCNRKDRPCANKILEAIEKAGRISHFIYEKELEH